MARIFPERPPEGAPDSEKSVFRRLASDLSDEFAVFHSVAWHRGDGQPDGEIDFLVAHPEFGMLTLEVKGGGIEHDPRWGWYSTNRYGARLRINDPFQQALTAKHAILRDLKEDPRWPPRQSVQIGYAVCFPSVEIPPSGFTARGKREITLGKNDLPNLSAAIQACLQYWLEADPADRLGQHGFRTVLERYGRSWRYQIPLKDELVAGQQRIVELTEQQMEGLRLLERRPRAAIAGCAGSGKTLMAIARAQQLAGEGKRVLLTCYNKALAEYWRASLHLPSEITADHFHGICATAVRQSEIRRPNVGGEAYVNWLPAGLFEAIAKDPLLRFDAVIVDEGQDFSPDWLEVLELLLSNGDGSYFIFYDDNQDLYSHGMIPAKFLPPYSLTKNVRNTDEIGRIVHAYYPGEMRLSGVSGRKVRFIDLAAFSSERAALEHVFDALRKWGAEPAQVVVLTPAALARSRLLAGGLRGPWVLHPRDSTNGNVLIETIHSFKGQDREVVILAELDRLDELTNRGPKSVETLLYVGSSRATQLLIVLGPSSLKSAFEAHGAVTEARLGEDIQFQPLPD